MKRIILAFILLITGSSLISALTLSEMFGEGMVLQQGNQTRIFGTAQPHEPVSVRLSEMKAVYCKADDQGNWLVEVTTPEAGGPYTLQIKGAKGGQVKLSEVYVGDVWLAGGQSNMYFQMRNVQNAKEHIARANNPMIRMARIPLPDGLQPSSESVTWTAATGKSLEWQTAVGYFFAKEIYDTLNYPIGIISCNRGSTSAETWVPREDLMRSPVLAARVTDYEQRIAHYKEGDYELKYSLFKKQREAYNNALSKGDKSVKRPNEPLGKAHPSWPSAMYEMMLSRTVPFSVKGVIWYQGESNATRYYEYEESLTAVITSWRKLFRDKGLPFYFVQLSNYGTSQPWAELREVQSKVADKIANTGMAVSIDCGAENDIHPTNKEPVGKRLAAIALAKTYKRNIQHRGPEVKKISIKGESVEIDWKFTDGGLKHKENEIKGFTICGQDSVYYTARAVLTGNKITLSSEKVSNPIAIRYGWASWTDANLSNGAGFPVSPFRLSLKQ